MKLSNAMNNKPRKYQKFETALDRKAKKAEKLRLRNVREQTYLNNQSTDSDDDFDIDEYDNLYKKDLE